jgi:hypothetical protein
MPALGALEAPSGNPNAESFRRAAEDAAAVTALLDGFHEAASRADGDTYFAMFAPGAMFIGTDASERWDIEAFKAYAQPYFAKGQGWTYHPRSADRNMQFEGDVVIFDELLDHDRYGVMRGSGAVVRTSQGWKIKQYVLSFTVPNDSAPAVVAAIAATPAQAPAPTSEPSAPAH